MRCFIPSLCFNPYRKCFVLTYFRAHPVLQCASRGGRVCASAPMWASPFLPLFHASFFLSFLLFPFFPYLFIHFWLVSVKNCALKPPFLSQGDSVSGSWGCALPHGAAVQGGAALHSCIHACSAPPVRGGFTPQMLHGANPPIPVLQCKFRRDALHI